MKIIQSIDEMKRLIANLKRDNETIGYVPTMGYLHEGHLSLMKKAREENSVVIISVFVNPLQFGPNEDYDSYPRDFERDELLAKTVGVDYLFYPSVEEMYPNKMTVEINVKKRVDVLCGRKRPGHFDGVATVLTKLFLIIQPANVYFGLKDAQQVAVVNALIKDFNFPICLRAIETVREGDGLAKSSRNVYLTEEERKEAPYLYQSLLKAENEIVAGERNPEIIITKIKESLQNSTSGSIDYVEIYSYPELEELQVIKGKVIVALAVRYSKARLIDNIIIEL